MGIFGRNKRLEEFINKEKEKLLKLDTHRFTCQNCQKVYYR